MNCRGSFGGAWLCSADSAVSVCFWCLALLFLALKMFSSVRWKLQRKHSIFRKREKQREDVKFVWKHWQLLFWGVCCRKLSSVFAVAPKCPRVNTQKIEANDCSVALLSIPKIPKIAIEPLKAAPFHVAPWRRCGKHCLRTGSGWGRVV